MPRPPFTDPDQRLDAPPLRIRLTRVDRKKLDAAAAHAMKGQKGPGSGVTSTWARDILLRAAERQLKKL